MTGGPEKARAPCDSKRGSARVSAQMSPVKFASEPLVVKWPTLSAGRPARRDGADDVCLDLHRRRGGTGARQLRIEGAGDAIGALRGEVGRRVEKPEVARVVHVH